ncbi:putative xanthine dehydrogenase subunit A [Abditibacteriota bacterium]|nr:putative xanthine dehydrogenase subunit A [Abditibacteriota bacterium]
MHEREAILELWRKSERSVLATVVEVKGSAYRRAGARMLLTDEGHSAGVINGGCLDADLHARTQMVLETGQAQLAVYDTTSAQDIVFGLGLGCRGVVKILLEPARDLQWLGENKTVEVVYEGDRLGTRLSNNANRSKGTYVQKLEPPQPLLIFGAGADVVPLQEISVTLGWSVQIFDLRAPNPERPVFVEAQFFKPEKLADLEIPECAACVIMTHNFLHDLELLKTLLPSGAAYIGILGPRRRTDELLEKLGDETLFPGVTATPEQLERLFAPVGLDLGAETPEEIALSIIAEIQRVRRNRSGASLRERRSIH